MEIRPGPVGVDPGPDLDLLDRADHLSARRHHPPGHAFAVRGLQAREALGDPSHPGRDRFPVGFGLRGEEVERLPHLLGARPEHGDGSQVLAQIVEQHPRLEALAHHPGRHAIGVGLDRQRVQRAQCGAVVGGTFIGRVGGEIGQLVVVARDPGTGRADRIQPGECADVGVGKLVDRVGHFGTS